MNRMIDEYMCHDPKQILEDVEQEAYNRGYNDCASLNQFFRRQNILAITHTIVAVTFFLIGILYAINK